MSVFDSERARIEIGSFQQIATEQCRLGGAERIIVGYTNACFGAEKAIKYLLDIENDQLQLGKSDDSLKKVFKKYGHDLEKLYNELHSSTTKDIEAHYSNFTQQEVLGTAREVFEQTKDHFVRMRYMDEDGSGSFYSFYPQVINATASIMFTTHPPEYWEITREYVPWSKVKGNSKTHFEKIGFDPLKQRTYIPRVKPI